MLEAWDIPNMDSEPRQIKMTDQRKIRRNGPKKTFRLPLDSTQKFWVCLCVYPHILYSFSCPKILASLHSVFVGILFCKAKKPGPLSLTTGPVVRICCSHCRDPASISTWEAKPHFKSLQAEAFRDQSLSLISLLCPISTLQIICWLFLQNTFRIRLLTSSPTT